MKYKLLTLTLFLGIVFTFTSCNRIKNKTKETINKGGETVGKSATEFIEGIGEGIEKTLALKIEISEDLKTKGISTGKYYVENSNGGNDNLLTVYIIFEKDFSDTLFVKAYDKEKLEVGRISKEINGKKGEALYIDFEFDKRTILESKGIIQFE
ncbi:hypothetical protein AB9K26_08135 [Psychroserpens sp. XS_ASV72]|uniref:hypothetical protein n=1 Tax=Psychroserpens sp. XS_ASV72 TaxID=3241293 RepID=UPI003516E9C4